MEKLAQQDILVSADVAAGLLDVLQETSGKRAKFLAGQLARALENNKGKRPVRLPMAMIAQILRVLLLVFFPESTVHAILLTLERL